MILFWYNIQTIEAPYRHWRDAKKSNREEKEKYGIHILSFEKRKEKCRDLFSGSRREREFLPKKWRNFKHFLQFRDEKRNPKIFSLVSRREREILQKKSHDSRGDRDVEISNFLWRERKIHHSYFSFFLLS